MNSNDLAPTNPRPLSLPRRTGATGWMPPATLAVTTRRTTLPTTSSEPPFPHLPVGREENFLADDNTALDEAWRKVYRVRELFDAELANLRAREVELEKRTADVTRRESVVAAQARAILLRDSQLDELERMKRAAAARARTSTFAGRLLAVFGLTSSR